MKHETDTLNIVRIQKKHGYLLRKTSGTLVFAMLLQGLTPFLPVATAESVMAETGTVRIAVPSGAKRAFARTAAKGGFTIKALKEAGEHGGGLCPTTEDPIRFATEGNEAFGACMQLWNAHDWETAKDAMLAFPKKFPGDPWLGEADLHVGCYHKFRGEYREAEAILVDLYESNTDNPIGRKALVRLGHLYFETFRYQKAAEVFQTLFEMNPIENEKTFARNWLFHINRSWMSAANNRECGPKAFGYAAWLIENQRRVQQNREAESARRDGLYPAMAQPAYLPTVSFGDVAEKFPWADTKGDAAGMSLEEMGNLLAENGWSQRVRRVTYEKLCSDVSEDNPVVLCLPAPADAKFKTPEHIAERTRNKVEQLDPFRGGRDLADIGHYVVLLKADERTAWVLDPENGLLQWGAIRLRELWLQGQSTGLVALLNKTNAPSAAASLHGDAVPDELLASFKGGCCGHNTQNDDTGCDDGEAKGMPEHKVNIYNMNYLIVDTPMWIESPRGADLNLTLTYNNRESTSAKYDIEDVQFHPFGYRWSAPYDGNYALDPYDNILVHFPNGMEVMFDKQTNGSYLPRESR
ncbi:MAG: hypothetical protein K9L89_04995, partial [Kiritimatiellales bacterium]|nr:hypothetical protein [Kiritimatiellales bacterium]